MLYWEGEHYTVCDHMMQLLEVYVYTYVHAHACMCTHTNTHMHVHTHTCMCTHTHTNTHKYMHTYTHTHTNTHTHTHTHTHALDYQIVSKTHCIVNRLGVLREIGRNHWQLATLVRNLTYTHK